VIRETHGRVLDVAALARVEGEGAMRVRIEGDTVVGVELDIYEPPRFFEAFLRGRGYEEPPDITARICGICPVAYQMSSSLAIEQICGVTVDGQLAALRRLLYCGEWIESHALHIYLLHAPDFLGYDGGIAMARDHRDIVERGLRLKQVGNRLMELVGGRAVHPVNVRVGGFYRLPDLDALRAMVPDLQWACGAALDTVSWVAGFDIPDHHGEWDLVALAGDGEYPIMGRRIVTSSAPDIVPIEEFGAHAVEEHVAHSHALHASWDSRTYLVGPLARYSPTTISSRRSRARRLRPQVWAASAATRSRASWCVPSSCSPPAPRRYGSCASTSHRPGLPYPSFPGRASATVRARHPAGCSTTATSSTSRARSSRPPSCHRRRRTSAPSSATSGRSRRRASRSTTRRSRRGASSRFATTTRASRARRTTSTCG